MPPPEHESRARVEVPEALVEGFADTFIARTDCYPFQNPDGSYVTVKRPLHPQIIRGHLLGHITLGAYLLDASSQGTKLVFDADRDEDWKRLLAMAAKLEDKDIPAYRELSRRGGHVWIFTPLLPAQTLRRFGKALLKKHKLPHLELYPKQDRLTSGPGSLVRLPFGVHLLTKTRYSFIQPDGTPLAPTIREQIARLSQPERVANEVIETMLKRVPEPELPKPTTPFRGRKNRIVGDTPSERIKNRMAVVEFVSQYVELDASGRGRCPFHDDQVQSFQVNLTQNYWHCYAGCGGGSVIDFWMKWRQKNGQSDDFTATITELANMLL